MVLQVEDNGPGIGAEEKSWCLQPFYRALGNEADGSGLGLPIVQEIAAQHGGELLIWMPTQEEAAGHLHDGAPGHDRSTCQQRSVVCRRRGKRHSPTLRLLFKLQTQLPPRSCNTWCCYAQGCGQGLVFRPADFFGTALQIESALKSPFPPASAQGVAQNFSPLAEGHLHQLFQQLRG